jgi:class 3 adenylate cyclase
MKTHVMTDIRDYALLLENRGDDAGLTLMRAYERIVRMALPRKSVEADHIGDSFHLVFPTPTQAVRTAVAIAEAIHRHNGRRAELHLPVGFGVDTGQSVRHGTHYQGSPPILATRLARRAQAGQILVSEAVFALLKSAKAPEVRDLGVWKPSGGKAVHLYEVRAPDPQRDGSREADRFLTALLFEDIVGSTAMSARLGDQRWGHLVEEHHAIVRDELRRHRGMEIDTAGDGFYAAFDAPSRAIECALAIHDRVRLIGIEVRAGIHAGECEVVAGKIAGMTVTIGARVGAEAGPGDVLVSSTVKEFLVGAAFTFTDRGRFVLKGVPGDWMLYGVDRPVASDEPA